MLKFDWFSWYIFTFVFITAEGFILGYGDYLLFAYLVVVYIIFHYISGAHQELKDWYFYNKINYDLSRRGKC